MSFLKKLFGGGATETQKSEAYDGFAITPTPQREGTQYRIGARIEKEIGGQVHTHNLVRADTMADQDEAAAASIAKAKQMIDEQGDRIFG
ncbi:HlyU family transcriptional regulator [uncultured Tateyamaria sp.]|uniref:HlyU family transcriptional regulator n=1 Tax=uncultured Tateyamaria sp. TaxID=455651 RepID=UPI002609CF33|nr:HlyU family transcriptional regulator [uncultured Tateyamaria sp.]